jgi:hypothetical protein
MSEVNTGRKWISFTLRADEYEIFDALPGSLEEKMSEAIAMFLDERGYNAPMGMRYTRSGPGLVTHRVSVPADLVSRLMKLWHLSDPVGDVLVYYLRKGGKPTVTTIRGQRDMDGSEHSNDLNQGADI